MRFRKYTVKILFLLFPALLLLSNCVNSTFSLKKVNFRSHYALKEPLTFDYKVMDEGENLKIYLLIHDKRINNEGALKNFYRFSYRILPGYSSKETLAKDTVLPSQYTSNFVDGERLMSFSIPKLSVSKAVMELKVFDVMEKEMRRIAIDLHFQSAPLGYRYAFFKENEYPLLKNYIHNKEEITLRSLTVKVKKLYGYYYGKDFDPAAPPMARGNISITNSQINIDSTFEVFTGQELALNKQGLYFFQEDPDSDQGFSLFVGDGNYPSLTKTNELIAALIYISSRKERDVIANAPNKKIALDDFWLSRGGNEEISRQLIKSYYQRVERANKLFTTYKEGWKTDMGIIYVIFGDPSEVLKYDGREIWVYRSNQIIDDVYFTFFQRPVIFYENNYVLERDIDYDRYWYPMVESWRKGVIRN